MASRLAFITFLDDGDSPTNPIFLPPVYPGHGLPHPPVRPDNSLPGGAINLPVFPFDPTLPNNELPTEPPVRVWPPQPGMKFVIKWLACSGLVLVPDNTLPGDEAE